MKLITKLIASLILVSFASVSVYAWEFPNNQSGYPYASSTKDEVDQWNTYTRNCTSYTMWKINQAGVVFNNNPTGPNGQTATMGNAENWDNAASSIGYNSSTTASIGNPVNWESNSGGAGNAGHVAWVERINTNGSVFISEWNWNWGDGNYNERNGVNGDHYISISNSNIIIQNLVINSGQVYNRSVSTNGTITILPETTFVNGSTVNLSIN
mgnify:CR=1 FL=1